MLLKALRKGIGSIIIFIDWVTRPKPITRTAENQEKAQQALKGIALYQLHACPFCIKTRRALHRLNVSLEINDIGENPAHRDALKNGGGRIMVPCLKIDENDQTRWLYESDDIISFLEQRVSFS